MNIQQTTSILIPDAASAVTCSMKQTPASGRRVAGVDGKENAEPATGNAGTAERTTNWRASNEVR